MASEIRLDLLSNASATGSDLWWEGGRGTMFLDGTLGGATVTLEALHPATGTALVVGTEVTFTAVGLANFELPPCKLRAVVSGGSPSGLYATIVGTRVE